MNVQREKTKVYLDIAEPVVLEKRVGREYRAIRADAAVVTTYSSGRIAVDLSGALVKGRGKLGAKKTLWWQIGGGPGADQFEDVPTEVFELIAEAKA